MVKTKTEKNKSAKFLNLVGKHRETKKEEKFHGTLKEYLAILEDGLGITQLAHKRLYSVIAKEQGALSFLVEKS